MTFVNVEISYEGGIVVEDRVLLEPVSANVRLPRRLVLLMNVMDGCDQLHSFVADCDGTRYPVKHEPERGYFIDFDAPCRRVITGGPMKFFSLSPAQRRLNGRFAHMISAASLIAACFEVATMQSFSWHALLEPVCLGVLSVALYVVGHRCFAAPRH